MWYPYLENPLASTNGWDIHVETKKVLKWERTDSARAN